ncbi:hypothetical protein MJO29_016855 [Puccinia striiformis f. sp. tritici]|nr:hypothetical protein MJO29_016855 [Puccinia striiformis f. sp. tritici]
MVKSMQDSEMEVGRDKKSPTSAGSRQRKSRTPEPAITVKLTRKKKSHIFKRPVPEATAAKIKAPVSFPLNCSTVSSSINNR